MHSAKPGRGEGRRAGSNFQMTPAIHTPPAEQPREKSQASVPLPQLPTINNMARAQGAIPSYPGNLPSSQSCGWGIFHLMPKSKSLDVIINRTVLISRAG